MTRTTTDTVTIVAVNARAEFASEKDDMVARGIHVAHNGSFNPPTISHQDGGITSAGEISAQMDRASAASAHMDRASAATLRVMHNSKMGDEFFFTTTVRAIPPLQPPFIR